MTEANTDMVDADEQAGKELRKYAAGFVASAALTAGAFAAAVSNLTTAWKVGLICAAAVLQIAAHMLDFLHLSFSGKQSREDLLLVLFSISLLAIMAGGTWYIMADLGGRMHEMTGEGHRTQAVASPG
ncbi:cytochrome C oxidase subunit IV family protein [Tsuneonella amylolytica]|uniref:cytochrome C oxidase subunit IV family protein n=1 Tax=Tsuneonella amylolytica TaxID=2338327 RepID=UPI000EA916A8|nr:cytochrome C oxidase subunit IV family protein [Tsuneonella amylolytica]